VGKEITWFKKYKGSIKMLKKGTNNHDDQSKSKNDNETKIEAYEKMVEAYKKSASDLRWVLGLIIAAFFAFNGYLFFSDSQEYERAVKKANDAVKETTATMEKIRTVVSEINDVDKELQKLFEKTENDISQKLEEAFQYIDSKVAKKLQEVDVGFQKITNKGDKVLGDMANYGVDFFRTTDLWRDGIKALDEKKYRESAKSWKEIVDINPQNENALYNWGMALAGMGEESDGEEADKYFTQAYEKFEKPFNLDPNERTDALLVWADILVKQAHKKQDKEQDKLFCQAYEKYEKALSINPSYVKGLSSWGLSLVEQAKTKQGNQVDKIFEQAFYKLKQAIKLEPGNDQLLLNYGISLYEYADKKEEYEKIDIFKKAKLEFEKTLSINPNNYNAWNYLGIVYAELLKFAKDQEIETFILKAKDAYLHAFSINSKETAAIGNLGCLYMYMAKRCKNVSERRWLIEQACEKYEWAFHRKSDSNILRNWALAYETSIWRVNDLKEIKRFSKKACEKYEIAVMFEPKNYLLVGAWAESLLELSRVEKGMTRQNLLHIAKQKCELCESIKKGSAAFLLACISAMEKDEDKCKFWLKIGGDAGTLPTLEDATRIGGYAYDVFNIKMRSGHLESMKNKKWFKTIKWGTKKSPAITYW